MADIGPIAQGYTHSYGAFDGRDAPNWPIRVVLIGGSQPSTTPPTVTVISPAPGATIRPTDEVVVLVTDDGPLSFVELTLRYRGEATEVIVRDGTFRRPYSGSRSAVAGGYLYTIRRDGGWPKGTPIFEAIAVDTYGNVT